MQRGIATTLLLLGSFCSSCSIKRTLTVTSEPPGALVRLDETVIGRTPLVHEFDHYGRRRVTLYLPGYLTHSTPVDLDRPWYAAFPIDLITELLLPYRIKDRRYHDVMLEPDSEEDESFGFGPMLRRAQSVRARYATEIEAQAATAREAAEAQAARAAAAEQQVPEVTDE